MKADDDDWRIIQAMEQYGGSFTRALAHAFFCADAEHQARIREAFPDLWTKYRLLADDRDRHK